MARKGAELRTDFTGDDTQFNKVLKRNIKGAKKFGNEWEKAGDKAGRSTKDVGDNLMTIVESIPMLGKLGKALKAGKALWDTVQGVLDTLEEMVPVEELLLADMANLDFEQFQALSGVLQQVGIDVSETSELMVELSKKIGEFEMDEGAGTVAEAFAAMGLNVKEFKKLDPIQQVLALSGAMEKLGDRSKTLAALEPLVGGGLANKLMLLPGPEDLINQMANMPVFDEDTIRQAKKGIDEKTRLERHTKGRTSLVTLGPEDLKKAAAVLMPSVMPDSKGKKDRDDRDKERAARKEALRKFGDHADAVPALMGMQGMGVSPSQNGHFKRLDALKELQKKSNRIQDQQLGIFGEIKREI